MKDSQERNIKNRRTIELKPHHGEMIKPAELIDISGASNLSLVARRIYNQLIANAFGLEMATYGHEWSISLAELRGAHNGNEHVAEAVLALMQTVVTVKLSDGATRRVQLLGGNDMEDATRQHGKLSYSFDHRLVDLLKNSTIFGKLEIAVMMAFTSKYALALYEAVSRRVRLKHKFVEAFSIPEFRDLLGVETGKLETFSNLNLKAIKPAVQEVNALAHFNVKVLPEKTGRKVTGVSIGWWNKNEEELKAAYSAVRRHGGGRHGGDKRGQVIG